MTFYSEGHLGQSDCSKMRATTDLAMKRKREKKNQYGAIKHKASLGGVEGNLLFIKFTPPSPSPSKPQTSVQLLMHELPLHLLSSLQVI